MGADGTQSTYSCDNYYITPPGIEVAAGSPPDHKLLYIFDGQLQDPHGGFGSKVTFEITPGTVAYIENENGHTVDVVRPTKYE